MLSWAHPGCHQGPCGPDGNPVLPPLPLPASSTRTLAPLSHPPTCSDEQPLHSRCHSTPHRCQSALKVHPCFANLVSLWGCTLDSSWKEQAEAGMPPPGSLPSQPCSPPAAALPLEIWARPQIPISLGDHMPGQGVPPPGTERLCSNFPGLTWQPWQNVQPPP